MVYVKTIEVVSSLLGDIQPASLIAIGSNLGFYFSHRIVYNPHPKQKQKKILRYNTLNRMLVVNPTDEPSLFTDIPSTHCFSSVKETDLLGIHYFYLHERKSGLQYNGRCLSEQNDNYWPPQCALCIIPSEGGWSISSSPKEIVDHMERIGFHCADLVRMLKTEVEPRYRQEYDKQRRTSTGLKLVSF